MGGKLHNTNCMCILQTKIHESRILDWTNVPHRSSFVTNMQIDCVRKVFLEICIGKIKSDRYPRDTIDDGSARRAERPLHRSIARERIKINWNSRYNQNIDRNRAGTSFQCGKKLVEVTLNAAMLAQWYHRCGSVE